MHELHDYGTWRRQVARSLWEREARGSIPRVPTHDTRQETALVATADATDIQGYALYFEFSRELSPPRDDAVDVAQLMLLPAGFCTRDRPVPASAYYRLLPGEYSAGSRFWSRAAAETHPEIDTVSPGTFRSIAHGSLEYENAHDLNEDFIAPLLIGIAAPEWVQRVPALVLQVSAADLRNVDAARTPSALVERIGRARAAAGLPARITSRMVLS